jgi:hypothetical protein
MVLVRFVREFQEFAQNQTRYLFCCFGTKIPLVRIAWPFFEVAW